MADFISAGRKPKINQEILQLPKEQRGSALPKMENDVLSVHTRIISFWVIEQEGLLWLEMEAMISQPFHPTKKT